MQTRWVRTALALLLLAGALAAQKIKFDYNDHANWRQFHTWSWGQVRARSPLWEDRIRTAVGDALTARGLRQVPSDGDLVVSAIGIETNHTELETYYNGGWGLGWRWRGWMGGPWYTTTVPVNYPEGTLVVDLFDRATHELVFRGSATETVTTNNPAKEDKKVDEAAKKLVDKLPLKKG